MGRPGNQRRYQLHQATERLAPSPSRRPLRENCSTMRDVLETIREINDDPSHCAEAAGPRYVQAGERRIHRRRHGRGFAYRNYRGRPVAPEVIARIYRAPDMRIGRRRDRYAADRADRLHRKWHRAAPNAVADHIPSHANTPALGAHGIRDALWVRLIHGHPSTGAPEVPRYQASSLITEQPKDKDLLIGLGNEEEASHGACRKRPISSMSGEARAGRPGRRAAGLATIWAADRPRRVFRNAYAVHEAI